MLVLTGRPNDRVTIGDGIILTIVRCESGRCRIGLTAPAEVKILREKLLKKEDGPESAATDRAQSQP